MTYQAIHDFSDHMLGLTVHFMLDAIEVSLTFGWPLVLIGGVIWGLQKLKATRPGQ